MDWLQITVTVSLYLVAFKTLLGLHWSWEPIVKAKKSLAENLERIKSQIPQNIYAEMKKSIDGIY